MSSAAVRTTAGLLKGPFKAACKSGSGPACAGCKRRGLAQPAERSASTSATPPDQAAKAHSLIPVEVYPLLAVVTVGVSGGLYMMYNKLAIDSSVVVRRNRTT